MSFNRKENAEASMEGSRAGKENNSNIEVMISKFRVENQAFSHRVQNLKSKIDNAYSRFTTSTA